MKNGLLAHNASVRVTPVIFHIFSAAMHRKFCQTVVTKNQLDDQLSWVKISRRIEPLLICNAKLRNT